VQCPNQQPSPSQPSSGNQDDSNIKAGWIAVGVIVGIIVVVLIVVLIVHVTKRAKASDDYEVEI